MNLDQLFEGRVTRTKKGSAIKRSAWGVGKEFGGDVYFHRNYVDSIPADKQALVKNALEIVGNISYNIVKVSRRKNIVSFIDSPDFDKADEPTVGKYTNVNLDTGEVKHGKSASIWHHKWLWVKDDYRGFDVDKSFQRSEKWLQLDDIEFSRIGSKRIWDTEYVPRINEL